MSNPQNLPEILKELRQLLPLLSERYGIETLGVFGSYVRQEASPTSDLDLLVTFSDPPGLIKFIELENTLSDYLGIRVDLVMKDALKPAIGKRILEEVLLI
jgi:hypothetical protein